jgi:hypothetical protein
MNAHARTLARISLTADQAMFFNTSFYEMLDDYIDTAPSGSNEAVEKPRYHGAAGRCAYLDATTNTACAGGYCVPNLFEREVTSTDPECEFSRHGFF